jgi:hypothetical protein
MKSLLASILVAGLLSGCGEREESVAETAGTTVGAAITNFASGVGEGVDKRMEVTVEVSDQCSEAGFSHTVAKSLGFKEGITVYFMSEKPFTGQMVSKAINADELEIGRSKVDVEFEADDAQYVNFVFDDEMDSQLVEKYLVDIRDKPETDPEPTSPTAEAATEDK